MHFIRAFPIILIVVLIFSFPVYADDSPIWIQSSSPQLIVDHTYIRNDSTVAYYFPETDIPVYIYGLSTNGSSLDNIILISNYPTTVGYYNGYGSTSFSISNSIVVNGVRYYFSSTTSIDMSKFALPIVRASSINQSINFVYQNVEVQTSNILYNITRFILASNNWLSSIVRTVMLNPLLIFILLFYFVGTAIGLLFRFRRY